MMNQAFSGCFLLGVIFLVGCTTYVGQPSSNRKQPCSEVMNFARSSQELIDFATNDGQGSSKRNATTRAEETSAKPDLDYNCSYKTSGNSTTEGKNQ